MGLISQKLRDSARGQDCRLRIPGVCSHRTDTVVLCHAPSEFKGMGNKGHDYQAAFGCHLCHEALDQHRIPHVEELQTWLRAMMQTQAWWVANGFIVVPETIQRAKPSKKILDRRHIATGETI